MIKHILKIILFLFPIIINAQVASDSILHSERSLISELQRLSHVEIIRLFPCFFETNPVVAFTIPCLPPVGFWEGNRISSGFGWRKHPLKGKFQHHSGIDIAGNYQYIRTTATGLVEQVGYDNALGLFVIVNHGNSYQTIYGHLADIKVKKNQFLNIGEKIGILGNTGHSTGKHLHYAIKKNSIYVNPAENLTLGIRFLEGYLHKQ
ncbi:M23 family metallopeptidase [Runella zeae]|uniref:M23 family metallopeptidase n=1 Tax=Runella zeae TaxID=94255 RepID=UPI00049018DD|nr:M23 family metallopeptidase [Runella zeae]